MVGEGGKHKNSKAKYSVDFTTLCTLTRQGKSCAYCYVASARRNGEYMAKTVIEYEPYNGFVKKMRPAVIKELNRVGGIRLFSFSDYTPEHRKDIRAFLDDCLEEKLDVKAITKSAEFIRIFQAHGALKLIHLSIDNLARGGSPITFALAKRYRKRYPKVLIRAVALDDVDLEYFGGEDWVDILTLNHCINGFHLFSRRELDQAYKKYPGRVCCKTGVCSTCRVKCGLQ